MGNSGGSGVVGRQTGSARVRADNRGGLVSIGEKSPLRSLTPPGGFERYGLVSSVITSIFRGVDHLS